MAAEATNDGIPAIFHTIARHRHLIVPVSFLALAVSRDPGRVFRLRDLEGTIFAVGCRTLTPTSNTNVGLPIVLAPAGLR